MAVSGSAIASRFAAARTQIATASGASLAWLWLGIAALALPTLARMAQISWGSEAGAHGPIVLATGGWLVWRSRDVFATGRATPLFPAIGVFALALIGYGVGRIISVLALETLSLYLALVTLLYMTHGTGVMRRLWFPLLYFLFMVTPPENYMVVGTQPIKMWLSTAAVDLLSWAGYAVGRTGVIIQIDGYRLLVATACSGVNSLIGICAISTFYVYLRHGSEPRYAALLTACLLPIAILANLLRIILLVLMTHYFGEEVAQGILHELTGVGIFLISLGMLIGLDEILSPVMRRLGWMRT